MTEEKPFPAQVTLELVNALKEWFPPVYATPQAPADYLVRLAGKGELIEFLEYQYLLQNDLIFPD